MKWMVALLLAIVTVLPAGAQYGSRGDKRYRDRYSRADSYGDVVELRLTSAGTLAEKMPAGMMDRVRLLRIDGPMDSKDFEFIKKLCKRSRCVDNRDNKVDNYLDLELERVRIMSSGSSGLLGTRGERDVLGDALSHTSHLRSIVLPERTRRIDRDALRGCSDLEEVIMPQGVRSIGDNAFDGCYKLEYITLTEGLESIGEECFDGCSRLTSVNLPYTLVEIGKKAFKGTGLKRVSLPRGLESLGAEAFDGTSITTLHLPASTRIEDDNLGTMKKLEEITVEDGSRYYTYEDGVLYDNTGSVLLRCPAARNGAFRIPDGVEEIAWSAFSDAQISSVTIPEGVTRIAGAAFYECTQLQAVNIPSSVKTIGNQAFYGCSRLQSVDLAYVTTLGKKAFQETQIALPAMLTTLNKEAFENCALTSLELPGRLVTIGERAFKNNKGLTSVKVPDVCVTVDKEAFRDCNSLSEIDLGNGLRFLGDNALRETAITTLVLPETVTEVGKKVAEKCKSLTRIECHAVLPPKLDGVSNNKVELYVPDTSVNAYKSAKNWKNFKNILPL